MEIEEIFTKIISHMKEGIQFHYEMFQGYNFLSLAGFSLCHAYHFKEESMNCMKLYNYYILHFHKLIQENVTLNTTLIPKQWYKYTIKAVDSVSRHDAVKNLGTKWVEWEQSTKQLYQEMYQKLNEVGEIAAAKELEYYIQDVSEELIFAEQQLIELEASNYDIQIILDMQKPMKEHYKKKLGW